jgi:hypothetical protein
MGLDLDPVLNIDLFHMSVPTFPPHPHAGFSAVTVMLPESKGGFLNRDNLGDTSKIEPGAVHWTQAGSGMMHEETPLVTGVDCFGFQIFVNLAAAQQEIAPRALHAAANEIPTFRADGGETRVLAGSVGGLTSPLAGLATPVLLLDVTVARGKSLEIAIPEGWRGWAFCTSGAGTLASEPVAEGDVAQFSDNGNRVSLSAGQGPLRALLGAGAALRQPIRWAGPFQFAAEEALDRARDRWRKGEMGRLSAR